MRIPDRLRNKLSEDHHGLNGSLDQSIAQFEPWLAANQVVFFEEYTDHGVRHVEQVLVSAASLIRDEAWPHVTAADAYVLIMATLLHDAAMHLSRDGFVTLLTTPRATELIHGFGDKPWDSLWEQFVAEARRFSGKQLKNLFGDTQPVREPPLSDPQRMDGRDLKLIGEFLRRHHHRLAHETALFGVPGPGDRRLSLESNPADRDLVSLAGLVARSHGLPLRSSLDFLAKEFDLREFQGAHAVFLMALLRIADYLQIQRERAPRQRLLVSDLRSPVSRREWAVHHAIRSVRSDDDPEALRVDARPEKVDTYLRLKNLIVGIQQELDSCWAVLGEVYGRFEQEGWSKFGLSLRRVRSNLDNDALFAASVTYHPRRAAFEADPDLMKLLVRPLYGRRPEIGIRELIQNAVDAVRERTRLVERYPEFANVDMVAQEADVVVWLQPQEDHTWLLNISDRGVGMTEETVSEYFLKAGASFRKSRKWQEEFTDRQGKSTVLRSGRFGIGALASFLLGDELTVTTRHISRGRSEGVEFSATLDSEVVELRKAQCDVGTRIVIRLDAHTVEQLTSNKQAWDWYCLDNPSVVRKMGAHGTALPQAYHLPEPTSSLPRQWRSARHALYQAIYWTYGTNAPELTCNGIRIDIMHSLTWHCGGVPFEPPRLSVFDPDGNLPLDLHRTATLDTYRNVLPPLLDSVVGDFIAFVMAKTSKDGDCRSEAVCKAYQEEHEISETLIKDEHLLTSTEKGILLNSPKLIRDLGLTSGFVIVGDITSEINLTIPEGAARFKWIYPPTGLSPYYIAEMVSIILNWSQREDYDEQERQATLRYYPQHTRESGLRFKLHHQLPRHPCRGVRIIARTSVLGELQDGILREKSRLGREEVAGWNVLAIGECPELDLPLDQLVQPMNDLDDEFAGAPVVVELCFDAQAKVPNDPVVAIWENLVGKRVIFWDDARRIQQIRECWPRMGEYLSRYGLSRPDL